MRIPTATYRLQLRPEFDFAAARVVLPYLHRLGISHAYLSPIFAARPGSSHGYDVVDSNQVNPELGGRAGLDALIAELQAQQLGWIQDVVPNHAAFHGDNPYLMDVLENGPRSRHYRSFDILWEHPYDNIRGRILAPFLGDFYDRCLERGELSVHYAAGAFTVRYYDIALPVRLASYRRLLAHDLERLTAQAGLPSLPRFTALLQFLDQLDEEIDRQPDFDHPGFVKDVLAELVDGDPAIRAHLDANLAAFNGAGAAPGRFDLLDALLGEQYFRLAYWKVGTEELNYRRFFSINELISWRVEEPAVLEATHRLLFELLDGGALDGLRIDHVDGLYDPATYLARLRARAPDHYLVVEKILEAGEQLPADWPVQGTTGYDFLDAVGGLLCDRDAARSLSSGYRRLTGLTERYADLVVHAKRAIVDKHMAGDIDNLALQLKSITNRSRRGNDLTMFALRRALVELLTHFPVYRTYVSDGCFSAVDRQVFRATVARCVEAMPLFARELQLIEQLVLEARDAERDSADRADWIALLMRLQQYTGPLMAKGVEDTTFYVYNRLAARNEVGCDPTVLGHSVAQFHALQQLRQARWPHALSATATHDTKRGEDCRARLAVLSERPDAWLAQVRSWQKLNRRHKTALGERRCPGRNDEYLLYQTLVGAMPFAGPQADDFAARVQAYMRKAAREAKRDTSWLNPHDGYEQALERFIARLLDPAHSAEFLAQLGALTDRVARFAVRTSLVQGALKLCCPGVPDLYQGSELWDLSLVDPDNRRPVDYPLRARLLDQVEAALARGEPGWRELLDQPASGAIKLALLHRLLGLRRAHPALFAEGSYQPLLAGGPRARHVVAFARQHGDQALVLVAVRFTSQLVDDPGAPISPELWGETALSWPQPAQRWTDQLTGRALRPDGEVTLGALLGPLPVAVYLRG